MHSIKFVRERRNNPSKEEEAILYYFLGLILYLVEFYIEEVLLGFLPHDGFP